MEVQKGESIGMIISELGRIHDYQNYPQVDTNELKYLWHSNFWDGPLSGMLLYNGEKYWFEIFAEADDDERDYRRFFIIELTPEQLQEEEMWHRLFQEKVGTNADYDEEGKRLSSAELKPKEQWREYYETYQQRKPLDLSQNTIIGWFETK